MPCPNICIQPIMVRRRSYRASSAPSPCSYFRMPRPIYASYGALQASSSFHFHCLHRVIVSSKRKFASRLLPCTCIPCRRLRTPLCLIICLANHRQIRPRRAQAIRNLHQLPCLSHLLDVVHSLLQYAVYPPFPCYIAIVIRNKC